MRFLEKYHETHAVSPVWLRLDSDDPSLGGYDLDYPSNWVIEIGERKPLSDIYNEVPLTLDYYGFIADDVVPKTPEWDVKLIELAGRDFMAVPRGAHECSDVAPHFVLGGDLVRKTGFVCLPGLHRIYIDTVWNEVAEKKYSDVILDHYHFSNKKALMDPTYKKPHKNIDKIIYEKWRKK